MSGRKRNPTDRFKEYKAGFAKRPNTATPEWHGVSFREATSLEIQKSPEPTPGSPGPSGGSSDVFTMTEPQVDVRPPLQNCMSEVKKVKHKYNVLRGDVLVELTQCGEYMAEKHFLVQAALGKHDQNCKALLDAEMKKTADAVKEVSELKSSTSASGKQRMDSAKSAATKGNQGGASGKQPTDSEKSAATKRNQGGASGKKPTDSAKSAAPECDQGGASPKMMPIKVLQFLETRFWPIDKDNKLCLPPKGVDLSPLGKSICAPLKPRKEGWVEVMKPCEAFDKGKGKGKKGNLTFRYPNREGMNPSGIRRETCSACGCKRSEHEQVSAACVLKTLKAAGFKPVDCTEFKKLMDQETAYELESYAESSGDESDGELDGNFDEDSDMEPEKDPDEGSDEEIQEEPEEEKSSSDSSSSSDESDEF